MRQFDLSPLYRSTIGFDRLFNMIDQAAGLETMPGYPPIISSAPAKTPTGYRWRSRALAQRTSRSKPRKIP
jgi:hypothetical protein